MPLCESKTVVGNKHDLTHMITEVLYDVMFKFKFLDTKKNGSVRNDLSDPGYKYDPVVHVLSNTLVV